MLYVICSTSDVASLIQLALTPHSMGMIIVQKIH